MKLTQTYLRRVIQEELNNIIMENVDPWVHFNSYSGTLTFDQIKTQAGAEGAARKQLVDLIGQVLECPDGGDVYKINDKLGREMVCAKPQMRGGAEEEEIHNGLRGIEDILTGQTGRDQENILDFNPDEEPFEI